MRNYLANTRLIEYLRRNIQKMNINENMKPVLVDILARRAYEYEFGPKEVTQDVMSLQKNLKKINLRTFLTKNTMARYVGSHRNIQLSTNDIKLAKRTGNLHSVYEYFTHEVYHALYRDENNTSRMSKNINSVTGRRSFILEEIIVEKSADRTVFDRSNSRQYIEAIAPYFNAATYGYSNLVFGVDIICSAYGVSEKQFLRNGLMGKDRLVSYLSQVAKEPPEATISFLDSIEANLTRIYDLTFVDGKRLKTEDYIAIETAYNSIANIAEDKMSRRITTFNEKDPRRFKQEIENAKFNHNKLAMVLQSAAKTLNIRPINNHNPMSDFTIRQIKAMDEVIKDTYIYNNSEYENRIFFAKQGIFLKRIIGGKDFIQTFPDTRTNIFEISPAILNYYYNEDFNSNKWISPHLANSLLELKESLFEKVRKNLMTSIANKRAYTHKKNKPRIENKKIESKNEDYER